MSLGVLALASLALLGPGSAAGAPQSPVHSESAFSGASRVASALSQDAPGIRDGSRQARQQDGPGRKGIGGGAAPAPGPRPGNGTAATDDDAPLLPDGPTVRKDSRARNLQQGWRAKYGDAAYRYCEDTKHRLVFATCLDETSHKEMETMLAAQADQQSATLFGTVPEVEVFIAIATPKDTRAIFAGSPDTAGMYEHPQRRLISSDIGTVLRHEFTHLMHFGHMERLGQPHPMWVQEGIASLYESYDLSADGAITFRHNPRHNQARALASKRTAMPLAQLVTLSPDDFMAKSQALYPQVRSIFEYLADTGKLRRWYRRYTETFATDRSGRAALEEVFGKPIAQVDADWRLWVLKEPAIDIAVQRGDRVVGIDVAAATDGVQVTKVERRSAAQRAGIRIGDVVISIAGQSVRSPREWIAASAGLREPQVPVVVRRKAERIELLLRFDDQASAPLPGDESTNRFPHGLPRPASRAVSPERADLPIKVEVP